MSGGARVHGLPPHPFDSRRGARAGRGRVRLVRQQVVDDDDRLVDTWHDRGGPASTIATGASDNITIQNFKFSPDKLKAKVGDKVTVTNLDAGAPHSLTADDKSFDTGTFNKGDSPKTITLSKAGAFPYHCEVHNFMKGTITVS